MRDIVPMSIRLRPHHLLCILTYVGRGYSPAFTQNYDRIAARIAAGEGVEVVDGPDDICAPLLATDAPHCLTASVTARDAAAGADLGDLLGCTIAPGLPLTLDAVRIARLRAAFSAGVVRRACAGCEWSSLCDDIAASGFPKVRVAG